jgi:hypothetical protein
MQERPHDESPNEPQPQGWPTPPAGPSKRNRNAGRTVLIVAAAAVAAIVAIGVSNKPGNSPAGDSGTDPTLSQPTDTTTLADPGLPPGTVADSPTPSPSPVPQFVTFACTGSAPDGLDITYGPEGSNLGASSLPFSKTTAYDSGAQYYVTTAQLSGSGHVTCTTTVQTDNGDGTADDVVNSGTASGGYNIASAQVCSSFTGGWEKC